MSTNKALRTAAAAMMWSLAGEHVGAQTTTPPATAPTQVVQPQPPSRRFLGLDVFGGGMGISGWQASADDSGGSSGTGWEVGGTLRFRPRLGVTSTFARTSAENGERLYHFLVGPRVNTEFGGAGFSRVFAHVLAGRTSGGGTPVSRGGFELVIGAGVDAFGVVRLQGDYVRARTAGVYSNGARGFIGAVIPFCFRGCRPHSADGFVIR